MHPILTLVVQRIALGLLLLLAVSAVIFLGVELELGVAGQLEEPGPEAHRLHLGQLECAVEVT